MRLKWALQLTSLLPLTFMKGELYFMAEAKMPDKDALPPNSHQYHKDIERAEQEEKENKPKAELSGSVTTKKKSLLKRFLYTFLKDGASDKEIKTYLLEDVLVPAVLENIADAINVAIEMKFFGSAKRRNRGASGNGSRVNYGSFYNGGTKNSRQERLSNSAKERSLSGNEPLDDYIFESRSDAEIVLVEMRELLDQYQQVTVADYLDILRDKGISVQRSVHTDNKFGWVDLSEVEPMRARGGGYFLDLPRERAL